MPRAEAVDQHHVGPATWATYSVGQRFSDLEDVEAAIEKSRYMFYDKKRTPQQTDEALAVLEWLYDERWRLAPPPEAKRPICKRLDFPYEHRLPQALMTTNMQGKS